MVPSRLRYHTTWTVVGWGFVLLVIYLSLMHPPQSIDARTFDYGHLLAYGWLMSWFAQVHRPTRTRLVIGLWLCALGVALEFVQGMTGYRTFDYADMGMNTLGVALGLVLARTPLQNVLAAVERKMMVR